jgi:hypothetical protein|tara:strand:+ start:63 stop:557 length:495 start_codon:yes stop_codon:yes gene_type:complete
MEIRNRSTGAVITISQFKSENQNTSFPKQITADILDSYGYDVVLNGPAATVTAPYGVSVRDGVEEIDGQWFTRFVAGPVFTDTTDGDGNVTTAADSEAAYRAGVDAKAAAGVRTERNKKLADSDWTQLADSGADATAWATYRQSLRDLPASDGFPHNVTWPTAP